MAYLDLRNSDVDNRPVYEPSVFGLSKIIGEESLKRQPMILRQKKFRQAVKNQREDVYGAQHRPALKGQPPSKSGTHLSSFQHNTERTFV